MKALLAAGALCLSLAITVPLSLAQTTPTPPTMPSTTQSTTTTQPANPNAPASTTSSSSTTSTTPLPAGGSRTKTTTSSSTTIPGSCRTHHADGEACSCLSAPLTMGTAQNHRCTVG